MKHKNIICILLIGCLPLVSYCQKKAIHLSGVIRNSTNMVQLLDDSEVGQLHYPDAVLKFVPDDKGNFSVDFYLDKAGYFQIGRNKLFLMPGDNVNMDINMKDPNLSVFLGSHKNENDYLRSTPFPSGGSFIESGYNIKATVKQSLDTIIQIASKRKSALESITHLSADFRALENIRIKADIINSLLSLPFYFNYENHIEKDSIGFYKENCEKLSELYLKEYRSNFVKSSSLKLPVYRKIADYLLANNPAPTKDAVKISDYLRAVSLINEINAADSKSAVMRFTPLIKEVKDSEYNSVLSQRIKHLLEYGGGDTAKNFVAKDILGNSVALKDFTGKVIFIEMWATWCVPCLEEIPYLDKLKNHYKSNQNIVFISLSVDNDQSKWEKKVSSFISKENQWIIDGLKLNDYQISGYPTSIIINKDFTIQSLHGPRPSSSQTMKILDEVLSK
jgi:thiol-disulfide isomerase/thioredoxin